MSGTRPTSYQMTHNGQILHEYLTNAERAISDRVYPWQFGAIADGQLHRLSERFSTLAEAQLVYPFVTSLNQSIDWAACQKTDLYARGRYIVSCSIGQAYHFGDSDYLELGISSKWIGSIGVNRDTVGVIMLRTKPANKPSWGKDCVVRVADASSVNSPDEFVRGIVFDGFILTRGVERRAASKADKTICFHANYAMGMTLGVVVFGAEFGIFGYSFWGSSGWFKADSNHKAFFADASVLTPEHTTSPTGSVNTTFNFDVRIDACPFGLVLKRVKYSCFRGYIEGIAASTAQVPMPIYDSANETPIAVTAINCDSVDIEQLGIEYWEGVILYNSNSSVSVNVSLTQDKQIKNNSGKQSAWKTIADVMGTADPHPLPASANSIFYMLGNSSTVIRNITGDCSNASTFSDVYYLTKDAGAAVLFENCAVYFGSNTTRFCNGSLARVETAGGRFIEDVITPSGFTKVGKNLFMRTSWGTKSVSAGDGRVAITVGSDVPAGLKLVDVSAYVIASAVSQPLPIAIFSASDSSMVFQTAVTTTAFSINWKALVSWV